jgi:uncharacterized protein (DUF2252 family)
VNARADSLDPFALARWQADHDRAATRKGPELLARKRERMLRSPHAFLRGTAPLFYRLLAARPSLAPGPSDRGWIVGDLHVENFGAWRAEHPTRPRRGDDRVVFDVNDLDLAALGPWRVDLARLTTSLLLAARDRGLDGARAVAVARSLLDAWRDAAFGDRRAPPPPAPVARLVAAVGERTRGEMLGSRTESVAGRRRFVRGPRYADLAGGRAEKCARAFGRYLDALPPARRPGEREADIEDVAFRIAGTGSLGVLRVAVLTRGGGPPDGEWIFELKETLPLPASPLLEGPDVAPAERVALAHRSCLARLPRMLGTTAVGRRSMLVRRLAPQEDKLDLAALPPGELECVARHLGALAGRAHRRGAAGRPRRAWRDGELDAVLRGAVSLAGLHVAAWLAWSATDP